VVVIAAARMAIERFMVCPLSNFRIVKSENGLIG
jgi:hypothetical protein